MAGLTRTLKLTVPPMTGLDVEAWTRGAHRYLKTGQLLAFMDQRDMVRRTFGIGKRTLAKQCAAKAGLPQYGVVGPALYRAMRDAGAFDELSRQLFARHALLNPTLIEPLQGFDSLHKSLWQIYSIGRAMGLTDLGTYNPASTLPGGGPSDHSVYPAYAIDFGIDPDTGYQHPIGRAFFDLCTIRPEVEYVILGDKIWSRDRGLRAYTAGQHMNHVHVSGNR